MPIDHDLLNPPKAYEAKLHKLHKLVQKPNSYFMDVKCSGCFNVTTTFSHATTVVYCTGCQTVISRPTGGKAKLSPNCSFRVKAE